MGFFFLSLSLKVYLELLVPCLVIAIDLGCREKLKKSLCIGSLFFINGKLSSNVWLFRFHIANPLSTSESVPFPRFTKEIHLTRNYDCFHFFGHFFIYLFFLAYN